MGVPLSDRIWLWSNVLVFTVVVIFRMIKTIFQFGVTKFFQWERTDRPAILDDPDLGKHGYLHLEEVRIHYVASGPIDKPLMLFVHGFPEFWFSWRHQIKEFQKDYRVVAVDMRGFGESDKPRSLECYAVKKLVKDVKQMVLALGYKSCVLVAHDWGGAIGWILGRMYPDVVEKLILLNAPPANVLFDLFNNDKAQKKKSWYIFFFQMPWLPELMMKSRDFSVLRAMTAANKEEWVAYKHMYSQPGALTPPINYYRSLMQQVGGQFRFDLNYAMPVILLWGADDRALSLAIPQATQKANPKITVKYIDGAGHFVHQDAPEEVNRLIKEWLADVE